MASTPASAIFVKKIIMYRRKMLKETDTRVKLTNQLLSGIRVLKIYAWEAAQEAQIQEARDRELRRLRQAIPCRVGMQTLLFAAPVLAAVASFAVYGSVDPDGFTAPRIFASIALFAIMRFPLIFLPFALVEVPPSSASLCSSQACCMHACSLCSSKCALTQLHIHLQLQLHIHFKLSAVPHLHPGCVLSLRTEIIWSIEVFEPKRCEALTTCNLLPPQTLCSHPECMP